MQVEGEKHGKRSWEWERKRENARAHEREEAKQAREWRAAQCVVVTASVAARKVHLVVHAMRWGKSWLCCFWYFLVCRRRRWRESGRDGTVYLFIGYNCSLLSRLIDRMIDFFSFFLSLSLSLSLSLYSATYVRLRNEAPFFSRIRNKRLHR